MNVLALVLVALVSVSNIIGCRSFALPALTILHDSNQYRCICRSQSLSSSSTRTPGKVTLQSNSPTAIGGEANVHVDTDTSNTDDGRDKAPALYIHIPYCRQRCRYCDFPIVPIGSHGGEEKGRGDDVNAVSVGEGSDQGDLKEYSSRPSRREEGFRRMNDGYVAAIVAELKQIATRNANKVPLRSIYFGGGTPSLAPIESIETILYHACGRDNPEAPFCLLQEQETSREEQDDDTYINKPLCKTEITMEMDPGTFDREYLSSLRALGINRVSLGVQSFDDDLLRAMGRTHRRADVLQAIRDIAFVFGGNKKDDTSADKAWENVNYSIDLISGCPGLTPAKWVETLQEATAGVKSMKTISTKTNFDSASTAIEGKRSLLLSSLPPPKHISVYDMQIEEGTVFGKWAAKAKEAAAVKRKEGGHSTTSYEDENDEEEDPSRQFTVSVSLDESVKGDGRVSRGSDSKGNPDQHKRLLRLPSEDECAFMYKYASGYLRAKNYEHYEVSSYAAFSDPVKSKRNRDVDDGYRQNQNVSPVSKRSVHNQIYWEYDGQWYAVGLGATSFVDKKLIARPREMKDYIEWVHDGIENVNSTTIKEDDRKEEDPDESFLPDLLLKRLRTIDGLDLSWLETNYGSETVKEVLEGAKLGLDLELAEHTDDNVLRLMDPEGLLFSNFIISSIFAELGYT